MHHRARVDVLHWSCRQRGVYAAGEGG